MNNLKGITFYKLTIIEVLEERNADYRQLCFAKCECGNIIKTAIRNIKKGNTRSCGCIMNEVKRQHGLAGHPIHAAWHGMKRRCYLPTYKEYNNYGGRGIIICDEWLNDVVAFYNWSIQNGWKEGLQIDREDVNGSYSPSNCRWVTPKVNSNNKRHHFFVTHNGITKTAAEWVDGLTIKSDTFARRIKMGWTVDKALAEPVRTLKRV
jgi:hypothetical protein